MSVDVRHGDSREVLKSLADCSIDSCVTDPPGRTVLDPFAGSGTTGMASMREGFDCILIEREAAYIADIKRRLAHVKGEDTPLFGGSAA